MILKSNSFALVLLWGTTPVSVPVQKLDWVETVLKPEEKPKDLYTPKAQQ